MVMLLVLTTLMLLLLLLSLTHLQSRFLGLVRFLPLCAVRQQHRWLWRVLVRQLLLMMKRSLHIMRLVVEVKTMGS